MKELTNRETEILSLIAEGKSNKLIAVELGIKLQTVKNHNTTIFLKLGVQNRTQAAMKAIDKAGHLIIN